MTPDNGAFAVAAYACAAILYVAYAIVLVTRERRLRARLDALEGPRR
jgi:hypothetical protein